MNKSWITLRPSNVRKIDLRRVAEYHAAGLDPVNGSPETRRLIRLALNEAEALAVQTGVPELVLPALAEEKVGSLRRWAARQAEVRARKGEMSLAA
jgi:hypothetical protein